jgi:hypothetical protein
MRSMALGGCGTVDERGATIATWLTEANASKRVGVPMVVEPE